MSLLSKSMAKSTWDTYDRALRSVQDFITDFGLPSAWPMAPAVIALYVSFMYGRGYAPRSIVTYLSAISYVHKLLNMPDPTASWLVEKLIVGAQKDKPSCDARLPITRPILEKLVVAASPCIAGFYERIMFIAMLRIAFAAFLRVGEMALSQSNYTNILTVADIQVTQLAGSAAVRVKFSHYKHSAGRGALVTVADTAAVDALLSFLRVRGLAPGFLFCLPSGKPVTREMFSGWLQAVLRFCKLDSSRYKTHSLRIGATCQAFADGYSETQIREWGRWHSDAYKRYLRFY